MNSRKTAIKQEYEKNLIEIGVTEERRREFLNKFFNPLSVFAPDFKGDFKEIMEKYKTKNYHSTAELDLELGKIYINYFPIPCPQED